MHCSSICLYISDIFILIWLTVYAAKQCDFPYLELRGSKISQEFST